ncbi:enoyl-CoA hydratase/isomerase family protein [bacterium]|nr:enoyl-CoA hydratase/isomerase family protein [bacterium]
MIEAKTYENILVTREGRVGIVTLHRPKALNALSPELLGEVLEALEAFDRDDAIGAMVLAGSDRAFAAGADIKVMAEATMVEMSQHEFLKVWDRIAHMTKPLIAAVSGFALGGGAELMMMCDMVIASETTKIGLPEVGLGVIPGAGGTQRLTRAVGKVLAMEMVLTGRQLNAQEAQALGLVNRVVPVELFLDEAKKLAADIAGRAPVAVRVGKESVNKAFETFLSQGLDHERKNFCMLFGTEDQKEGMRAFVEKRPATWKGL